MKGIAFERFLGRTFRGEIGQFFTPRSIVEFMIRMIDPKEGEVACDPASGSGGFLIRFFEIVREIIHARADAEYRAVDGEVASLPEEERARRLVEADKRRLEQLDQSRQGSPVWTLANRCIYGCDANERMARLLVKLDGLTRGRTDGALVRYVTEILPDEPEAEADARLQKMMGETVNLLPRFIPE